MIVWIPCVCLSDGVGHSSSVSLVYFFFFCFKQKTAYEMRISDWSSDVCSSDLCPEYAHPSALAFRHRRERQSPTRLWRGSGNCYCAEKSGSACVLSLQWQHRRGISNDASCLKCSSVSHRSEEHTSELQSLMRISYAVFCLKKKQIQQEITY